MKALINSLKGSQTGLSFSSPIAMIWLVGMFILLPLDFIALPLGLGLVDLWTIMALPAVWLSVPRGKHIISLYYMMPMCLILAGSFASTLVATAAKNGLMVILKEIFVLIWFITIAVALVRLNARDFQRLLVVWSAVVLGHGLVIVAQFLSPAIWQLSAEYLQRGAQYDFYRPSGLFTNSNAAAFFQLLGFVPLLLVRPRRMLGIILGLILLTTVLLTGSMASILSFTTGTVVALTTLSTRGYSAAVGRFLVRLAMILVPLGVLCLLIIGQNQRYQSHLQRILLGRVERSSESRFDLWERGVNIMVDRKVFLWGIGPDNFRVVDGNDNQLHNDFMAFLVERGVVSTLGLGLFALLAMNRALRLFLLSDLQHPDGSQPVVIVLLAAMMGVFVYSLTHQVFHDHQLWIILGFQEALHFKLMNSVAGTEPDIANLKTLFSKQKRFFLESSGM
jgi:hypothetical protein